MAIDTWGLLPKSQVDNETIEEAIDRLITAHNDDETAHLGTGQSLQSHKASEIIDHLIGAVVADKLSHQDTILQTRFESIDAWQTQGSVSLGEWGTVVLYVVDPDYSLSRMWTTLTYRGYFLNYTKTVLFQFVLWGDTMTDFKLVATLGNYNNDTNIEGFGFWFQDSVVKGFWGAGASPTFTSDLSIDAYDPHVYRAQFVPADKTVYFYVDGVVVGSLSKTSLPDDVEPNVEFREVLRNSGENNVTIKELMVSRSA